jgi:tetratricopeptide (TPR) repeat protein
VTTNEEEFDPEIKVEDAPSISDIPQAEAFGPVRKLLALRRYDEAIERLDEMAKQDATQECRARILRDRRFVEAVRALVEAGQAALRARAGEQCRLPLTGKIDVEGRILRVTDTIVEIDILGTGEGQEIELNRVHMSKIIELASPPFDPENPPSQAIFAVAYAMEEAFPEAYEALKRAASAGFDMTDAKGYVDSAKLWKAATLRDEMEKRALARRNEQEEEPPTPARKPAPPPEPLILSDRHRGAPIDGKITRSLEMSGFKLKTAKESITDEELQQAAVLLVQDPGPHADVTPYEEAEVASMINFVKEGGGFIFVGAYRLREESRGNRKRLVAVNSPFNPLLSLFGMVTRPDNLRVSDNAPEGTPRDFAPVVPARAGHPVLSGLRGVRFKLRTSSVSAPRATWLLCTSAYVESSATGRNREVLAAARQAAKGRVVVFGGLPEMAGEEGMDGMRLMLNAVRWASVPKMRLASAPE